MSAGRPGLVWIELCSLLQHTGDLIHLHDVKHVCSRARICIDGHLCTLIKVKELPAMEELQTDEATRARWIFYSALDAKATWELYHSLQVD
jgi:hypothetical protein